MAIQTKAVRQKIKSIGNIKKITKTMEMVSVSKMRRSVDRAVSSRTYSRLAIELLNNVAQSGASHPFLLSGVGKDELVVLVTSNKGLCGGYHANILKSFSALLRTVRSEGREAKVITIGKYAEKMAVKMKTPIVASFLTYNENSTPEKVKSLVDVISAEFNKGEFRNVSIVYTKFARVTSYKAISRVLLPIHAALFHEVVTEEQDVVKKLAGEDDMSEYTFEPSRQKVLDTVVPHVLEVSTYQTLLESFASEHSARMFAMKNAGDNASAFLEELSLLYNHARQDGITNELSEIVSGANALQGQ